MTMTQVHWMLRADLWGSMKAQSALMGQVMAQYVLEAGSSRRVRPWKSNHLEWEARTPWDQMAAT